jgi:hypothetical protein
MMIIIIIMISMKIMCVEIGKTTVSHGVLLIMVRMYPGSTLRMRLQ